MFITTPKEIQNSISALIDESAEDQPICLAVAFWGEGVEILIPQDRCYRIICNLSTGGTNPSTIRRLIMYPNTEVRSLPSLHAKVVLGQNSCLIGSANFSNSALGFKEPATWQEAAVLLNKPDERFTYVRQWFWNRWSDSAQVTESELQSAERKWELRTKFQTELNAIPNASPDAATTSYLLTEDDLFKPAITGQNKIRMASSVIETMFRKIEPNPDKTMIRVPAFVSNILWTFYGKAIATKIQGRDHFVIPAQVWERALEPGQPAYNEAKIQNFLSLLSTDADAPLAIRFWAKRYKEAGCPGAP